MPAPDKLNILIARFPGGSIFPVDMPDTTDYFAKLLLSCKRDPRFANVFSERISDTPITMSRNRMVNIAQQLNCHLLLMMDNDMSPDKYLNDDPYAEPFFDTSLDFMLQRWDEGPHIIGAPYCGPPPIENIFVFRWTNVETDSPNPQYGLSQFTREEAARRIGFERVAALPTGLILYDMRVFNLKKPPHFYYEWKDETAAEKASTEDVTQTRDAGLAGAQVWCNWSAWAGHYKLKCVGKPQVLYTENVGKTMRDAVVRAWSINEKVLIMGPDGGDHIPAPLAKMHGIDTSAPAVQASEWDAAQAAEDKKAERELRQSAIGEFLQDDFSEEPSQEDNSVEG